MRLLVVRCENEGKIRFGAVFLPEGLPVAKLW